MRNIVFVLLGFLVAAGIVVAVTWGPESGPDVTDADDDLVRLDAPPENFPLALPTAAEGTFLVSTSRETANMTTVTVQYALAEGVDEDALLERYGKLMASEGGLPVRNGKQVRAPRDRGLMTAQIVEGEAGPVLTLVAVVKR